MPIKQQHKVSEMSNISRHDTESQLALIWDALHGFRETCIPEGDKDYDDQWDEICSAMAFIREDLGLDNKIEYSREYGNRV